MVTFATIVALAVTGVLILGARWMAVRSHANKALRDVTVSRDWLIRHRAQDRL